MIEHDKSKLFVKRGLFGDIEEVVRHGDCSVLLLQSHQCFIFDDFPRFYIEDRLQVGVYFLVFYSVDDIVKYLFVMVVGVDIFGVDKQLLTSLFGFFECDLCADERVVLSRCVGYACA